MTSEVPLPRFYPTSTSSNKGQSLLRRQLHHYSLILYCLPCPALFCTKLYSMQSREASHAGSWYSDSQRTLTRQLDGWLAQVPNSIEGIGSLPVPGARIVIAPYV